MNKCNTTVSICQEEVLQDVQKNGHVRPWAEQKAAAERLAELYEELDHDKAERVRDCASWLKFQREGDGLKLALANFCRVRLCPVCQWRRSLKVYGQMSKIFGALDMDKYAVIALNLTFRNCLPDLIGAELDRLIGGYKRLIQYDDVASICKGYYRAVEITVNCNPASAWYGTLHPHIHSLIVVNRSYFTSRNYLSKDRWLALWRKAARLDYDPDIMVGRLKTSGGRSITDALREFCKYTVKVGDVCGLRADECQPADLIARLDVALNKRRFLGLGGIVKDLHKTLNLTEIDDDSDLIHVTDMDNLAEVNNDVYYLWRCGVYTLWEPN